MLYSFNLNFGYKDFDLSLFFQGISGRKIWTNFFGEDPFSQGSSPGKKFLRIYFSGENLLTFTSYPDYDPERNGDGWHVQYPQAKTYSLGLNLKF